MIRRPSVLLALAALVAVGALYACSGASPTSSSSSSNDAMAPRAAAPEAASEMSDASAASVAPVRISGMVGHVVILDPNGDSRFLINGYTVVARRGYTTIRQGFPGVNRPVADLTVGRRVHVTGAWLPSTAPAPRPVLAKEIRLQANSTPMTH